MKSGHGFLLWGDARLEFTQRHSTWLRAQCGGVLATTPDGKRLAANTLTTPTKATAELQPLIIPPQFRIKFGGCLGGLDQQVTHHGVALFADGTQALLTPATFFTGIQTQVTHHLLAALEAADWPDRQYKRQYRQRGLIEQIGRERLKPRKESER
jgi:hypothetical protein